MTDMTLKSQSEPMMQSAAQIAQIAIASAQANRKSAFERAPFIEQFAECQTHGKYPLNMQDERGMERWFAGGCQACQKQETAVRLLAASNISKRFVGCEFENFEASTDEQKHVLKRCESYANGFEKFRDTGACLLLCGRPGTGKNHLATAICKRLLKDGYSVLRIKASQYLDAYWSKSFDEREAWIGGMASIDLLMIDEIGRSSQAKAAQDAFFRLLDARYEAQLPTLLATNLNREDLIDVLGEATYDRLTQGGSIRLTLDWASHRSKKAFTNA